MSIFGYTIEKRAGVNVLVYQTGCRPATDVEAELYEALMAASAYINLLENCADGYYRVEETEEAKSWHSS